MGNDKATESHKYIAILRMGDESVELEVHPHPLLDPSANQTMGDEWWWDAAGMAIVKAGPPWTTSTGIQRYEEVPGGASWDWSGDGSDTVVTIPVRGGSSVAVTLRRSERRWPGGADGV